MWNNGHDAYLESRVLSANNKACEIVIELASSLDRTAGGEIALRLAQLYEYMLGRLMEANLQQTDAPLAEVLGLLATLAEAWDGVRPAPAPPPEENLWQPQAATEAVPAHGWNF
jgi:flagellar biosynthetic protein FliS